MEWSQTNERKLPQNPNMFFASPLFELTLCVCITCDVSRRGWTFNSFNSYGDRVRSCQIHPPNPSKLHAATKQHYSKSCPFFFVSTDIPTVGIDEGSDFSFLPDSIPLGVCRCATRRERERERERETSFYLKLNQAERPCYGFHGYFSTYLGR